MNTDTERIDFIEKLLDEDNGPIEIQANSLIGSQPNMESVPVEIFTIPSQHQYGKSAREVIDIAMAFESGERNWEEEHWPFPAVIDIAKAKNQAMEIIAAEVLNRAFANTDGRRHDTSRP